MIDVPKTEPEIEITPEMIDAGVDALLSNPSLFESDETIVERVYIAMRVSLRSEEKILDTAHGRRDR